MAARGHRADEHITVPRVVLHPDAVAEQRAAGDRAGRVDGEHGDGRPAACRAAPRARRRASTYRRRRPGDPDEMRPCRLRVEGRSASSAARCPGLDRGQEPGEGQRDPACARRQARGQGPCTGHGRQASVGGVRADTRPPRRWSCPGPKTSLTPASLSAGMSSSGMIPPAVTRTSSMPSSTQQLADARQQRHVRAGQDGQPDHVDVLLERRGGDHLRRLPQPRVDDLEALVPRRPRASTFAPRSCPSRPGLAMSTFSGRSVMDRIVARRRCPPAAWRGVASPAGQSAPLGGRRPAPGVRSESGARWRAGDD